jgi:hypothetical protein
MRTKATKDISPAICQRLALFERDIRCKRVL